MKQLIFHVDVNSAFLSWEATERLKNGEERDIRKIPSAVGGDPKKRHGVVLAKSSLAKKYGVKTGESLFNAFKKCPNLIVVPPNFKVYYKYSRNMIEILKEYANNVEVYSIDECFLDMTNNKSGKSPEHMAVEIQRHIYEKLGFTVNIGISDKKVLAKMASDFQKPNRVHTLYTHEIKEKLWPLPIRDLFMVGRASEGKLKSIGVYTIGDLANYDLPTLKIMFKKHGKVIYNFANGIDYSKVEANDYDDVKGIGNSTTLPYDIESKEDAHKVLLSLTENVCIRLRKKEYKCRSICVEIKNNNFKRYTHQKKLFNQTDCTDLVYDGIKKLFDECWKREPLRYLGVRVGDLTKDNLVQCSLFDDEQVHKKRELDKVLDNIRKDFGQDMVTRGSLLKSKLKVKDKQLLR
ncbi:MAG: DNA polymerase IV [Anaeromicrobium sp.]|jgi:DNA polymerase-4|uniref:Y-family DNA polymerase n=1 Tax=Anaeromicrobium sp. TaxID=1929132 RepID=UPI0025CC7A48|nr:DNA polymerase IV [Anaeromicrobium sp.]MCT4595175.1 DNA polymerase IV [Anaeromicrobium sp.]